MNSFYSPVLLSKALKSYLFDINRLRNLNDAELKKYQIKSLRKVVKFAYTVPLYHDKYKKAGVHPSDIKGINDIVKLPMVSKNDMRENFPDRILPVGYNKKKAHFICTGGTTGKSISIYTDFYTMGVSATATLRETKLSNLNWKKSRFANIGNFNPYRADLVLQENFRKHLEPFFPLNNQLDREPL